MTTNTSTWDLVLAILFTVALAAVVVIQLERTHRRATRALGRRPVLGFDDPERHRIDAEIRTISLR